MSHERIISSQFSPAWLTSSRCDFAPPLQKCTHNGCVSRTRGRRCRGSLALNLGLLDRVVLDFVKNGDHYNLFLSSGGRRDRLAKLNLSTVDKWNGFLIERGIKTDVRVKEFSNIKNALKTRGAGLAFSSYGLTPPQERHQLVNMKYT